MSGGPRERDTSWHTPGGGRTRAGPGLSRLPLPLGYGGDPILPPRLFLVLEEPLAGLPAQVARLNQFAQHLGGVAALALPVPILHRPIEDVESAEVEQMERPHRPIEALLHR